MYVATILLFSGCQQQEASTSEIDETESLPAIVGAWEIVESSYSTADTSWTSAPYRSVILFTKNYYSIEIANEDRPSWVENPDGEGPSNEEISNAYSGLTSNSGKYEVRGDSIYFNAVIAKYPNFMNDFPERTSAMKLEGDNLTLTSVGMGSTNRMVITKYKRLE